MVFILVLAMMGVTSSVLLYRDFKNRSKINDINRKLNTYIHEQKRQAQQTREATEAREAGTRNTVGGNEPK